MKKEAISTDSAPAAIGPYSQAVRYGDLLFISGQLPNDPRTGKILGNTLEEQTKQALRNIVSVAEAGGMTKDSILKVTVFLRDIANYSKFNEAYADFFGDNYPARECVGVAGLPKDIFVGISAICGK